MVLLRPRKFEIPMRCIHGSGATEEHPISLTGVNRNRDSVCFCKATLRMLWFPGSKYMSSGGKFFNPDLGKLSPEVRFVEQAFVYGLGLTSLNPWNYTSLGSWTLPGPQDGPKPIETAQKGKTVSSILRGSARP